MQNWNTCHTYHTKGAFQAGIITKKNTRDSNQHLLNEYMLDTFKMLPKTDGGCWQYKNRGGEMVF